MQQLLNQRLVLKDRFKIVETLSKEDQATYYSAWYYGAVRILLTIPQTQTKERIANRLALPLSKVAEVLEFLLAKGLVRQDGNHYFITKS